MNSKEPKLMYLFLCILTFFLSTSMVLSDPWSGMYQHVSLSTEIKNQVNVHQKIKALDPSRSPAASPDYLKFPLYFIPNHGQFDGEALFCARTSRYTIWLTKETMIFDSVRRDYTNDGNLHSSHPKYKKRPENINYEREVSRLIFLNSNHNPLVYPLDCANHRVNYFTGNDKSAWRTNIQTSREILYTNLYDKIDLKVYGVDEAAEGAYIRRCKECSHPVVLLSEEAGKVDLTEGKQGGKLYGISDPFDGSWLYKRGLPFMQYSSLVFFDSDFNAVTAVTGDVFNKDLAFANSNGAFMANLEGSQLTNIQKLDEAYRTKRHGAPASAMGKACVESYVLKYPDEYAWQQGNRWED